MLNHLSLLACWFLKAPCVFFSASILPRSSPSSRDLLWYIFAKQCPQPLLAWIFLVNLWASWWFQPIWKICSSNWIISSRIGVRTNIWNHHLVGDWLLSYQALYHSFSRRFAEKTLLESRIILLECRSWPCQYSEIYRTSGAFLNYMEIRETCQ